jgi:protein-glutamine gamma-glutamyltransferase
MIMIGGSKIEAMPDVPGFAPDAVQRGIVETMLNSAETYAYDTAGQFAFELKLRGAIVASAKLLSRAGMGFAVFRESTANPDFWTRTDEGGFQLKPDVKPSDAIQDIFRHGSLYATECATAMVIVYYRAMLDVMPEDQFNKVYDTIYLYDWESLDRDLMLRDYKTLSDELAGDAKYFINPDVDPLHPEWQGENAFYLGNGQYYGHGIGIASGARIIRSLNGLRKEDATREAYLLPGGKRQDYGRLYKMVGNP